MDDGQILNVVMTNGRLAKGLSFTTENGSGIMFFEDKRTQAAVFADDPSEIRE